MGRKSWEAENAINKYEFIDAQEFGKMIEEVAGIVYSDFCQLPEDSFICANGDLKPVIEAA